MIQPNDLLVVNNTRVFPARLLGKKDTGGKVEFMLLQYPVSEKIKDEEKKGGDFESHALVRGLLKSSKRPHPGSRLLFGSDLEGVVVENQPDATVVVDLSWQGELNAVLAKYGQVPLPPYIRRTLSPDEKDRERYQTVYADRDGAIAAPTAGLHFTEDLLSSIKAKGVAIADITLHVGYGTFAPVRVDDIRTHKILAEHVSVPQRTKELIDQVRANKGRVWAVGTTTARTLEFATDGKGGVHSQEGDCRLYIYPGYTFKVVDCLVTNFHLPQSSLLFLVSAFAGRERMMAAYELAVASGYRFYSYGDAMAITTR